MASKRATPEERAAKGVAARKDAPREAHAHYQPAADRRDPIEILERQAVSRVPELVPIRYGRMLATPFTFFRGAAAVMAADLAGTPESGLFVQVCGDAHLSNFGVFASPERRLVFDVNDFDETHPGPWEWDVKRLAASLEVAGRQNAFGPRKRRMVQLAAARGYQQAMIGFAAMHELDVWYAHAAVDDLKTELAAQLKKARRRELDKTAAKARTRNSLKAFDKLTEVVDGHRRIVSDPPLISPIADLLPEAPRSELEAGIRSLLRQYRRTLPSDRRVLFDAFEPVDLARKVVGVGSVGTRCWIALMRGRDDGDPLFLQVKEAQCSVIAEYGGVRPPGRIPSNEGERVVAGQRLMQAASDIFLGWQSVPDFDGARRDFYVRQLQDWKGSASIEEMDPETMAAYGQMCAWTLARAHARSGDRIAISGYLGADAGFPEAIAEFSLTYADQNERDHAALQAAVDAGRIVAETGV